MIRSAGSLAGRPRELLVGPIEAQQGLQSIDAIEQPLLTHPHLRAQLRQEHSPRTTCLEEEQFTPAVLPPQPTVEGQRVAHLGLQDPEGNVGATELPQVIQHFTRIGVLQIGQQVAVAVVYLGSPPGDHHDRPAHFRTVHHRAGTHAVSISLTDRASA